MSPAKAEQPGRAAPIGVFDSGIGGLTVVSALRKVLPDETLFYLGDTARVPYGSKSPDVVRRYALNTTGFLVGQGVKAIVIACNTATAHALEAVRGTVAMPVVGVIEPGAHLAAQSSRSGRIGVIGTAGTIDSGSYQRAFARLRPDSQVIAAACPLFVPLAEEGLFYHAATRLLAHEYLDPLVAKNIDTLLLGCTHYPLLASVIQQTVGTDIHVIDSATAVADAVAALLNAKGLAAAGRGEPDRFFATDAGSKFERVGTAFLGSPVHLTHVDL